MLETTYQTELPETEWSSPVTGTVPPPAAQEATTSSISQPTTRSQADATSTTKRYPQREHRPPDRLSQQATCKC